MQILTATVGRQVMHSIPDVFKRPGLAWGESSSLQHEAKVAKLFDLTRRRDGVFRRSVMADGAMSVMLSLYLCELQSVELADSTLRLTNLLERDEVERVLEQLIQAGLAVVTGDKPDRRTVGLTPLGSARMRSFISDYPDF
jgi:hypothetical protein